MSTVDIFAHADPIEVEFSVENPAPVQALSRVEMLEAQLEDMTRQRDAYKALADLMQRRQHTASRVRSMERKSKPAISPTAWMALANTILVIAVVLRLFA